MIDNKGEALLDFLSTLGTTQLSLDSQILYQMLEIWPTSSSLPTLQRVTKQNVVRYWSSACFIPFESNFDSVMS